MKAAKVLMEKNSTDITKIKEFFQKYGYNPRAKGNSAPVSEQEVTDSKPECAEHEASQVSELKAESLDSAVPSNAVSENFPRSPQLADFGLERYMISQVLPSPPQAVNNQMEEPEILNPSCSALITAPKTPKYTLRMDDFECVTPKIEHFGISEYTMNICLNNDYTVELKNLKIKSDENIETEPVINGNSIASPGLVTQQMEKNDAEYLNSPVAPTFCTPDLKIPSTKNDTALVSTNYLPPETNCSTNDLKLRDFTSLALNSDKCFQNLEAPSLKMASYEDLLRTPTPPTITTIPEDVLQMLARYNSNLATPEVVKAVPPSPSQEFTKYRKWSSHHIGKENY
ncbi:spindle and kinetochore-associated protein 3 isoform X2 [Erinaceus europaeus]|nr:spindle and kinetochore-associated protein 3 isoform X2 [Erinaceus europaeus]